MGHKNRALIIPVIIMLTAVLAGCKGNGPSQPDCDIHTGPCIKRSGIYSVMLNIKPRPVEAMKELEFEVLIKDGSISADIIMIELTMPGMSMKENMIILKRTGIGRYSGQGIIVRCPSGKKTWQANILLPDEHNTAFIFNVQ